MTLSRWRRLATGIAAGVLVLCAAILGASFRSESNPVSVASDLRPTDVIAIPEDDDEVVAVEAEGDDEDDASSDAETDAESDSVQVIDTDDLPQDELPDGDAADGDAGEPDVADSSDTDGAGTDADSTDDAVDTAEEPATEDAAGSTAEDSNAEADTTDEQGAAAEPPAPAPTPTPPPPPPPPPTNGEALGTGGGVNDAECGLDRLVIYAGAPVGGVAGRLRAALAQNGFGAGCPQPVPVLASNCPLQFSGVLREPGYDPSRPYVAASANVDRDTMISIVGSTGYTGNTIDILNFGFVNPDRPGEQWVAIFVPPSFSGWEGLASQAGLAPSGGSLCGPSGELGR